MIEIEAFYTNNPGSNHQVFPNGNETEESRHTDATN